MEQSDLQILQVIEPIEHHWDGRFGSTSPGFRVGANPTRVRRRDDSHVCNERRPQSTLGPPT